MAGPGVVSTTANREMKEVNKKKDSVGIIPVLSTDIRTNVRVSGNKSNTK